MSEDENTEKFKEKEPSTVNPLGESFTVEVIYNEKPDPKKPKNK